MAVPQLYNLARMTTATTGTGTVTLGSDVGGYLSFAGAGVTNGATVRYAIADPGNAPTAREWGTGVYTALGTTLTRVLGGSTTGSLLNLSGSAHVMITPMAEDFPKKGTVTLTASSTSTVVTDANCTASNEVLLIPKTAHAAASLPTIYVTTASGQFTISHASNSYTDKEFSYAII